MPTLGAPLDFAKLEARNLQAHQLAAAPSSPVKGQLYYNTGDNTLYWYDGTTWVTAKGGTAPDATAATKGLVQLAGDLAGTAASPQIATGVIVDTDVNAANKDGAVGTPSMRTIGTGAQQAMAGNTRLDTIAAPTGPVNVNNQRITGLATPTTNGFDAVNRTYIDNVIWGLNAKQSVRVASTGNVNIFSSAGQIDGITPATNDRVLLKNQTNPAENGIYYATPPDGYGRDGSADSWNELVSAVVWVEEGTANADTGWLCTVNRGGTLGSTAVTWVQIGSAAGLPGTPSGPAGGDLSGTYPNPQIATGTIVDADVAAANKDGAVATPSLRTLGFGAQQAMQGNRSLDQIANANAATNDLQIGGFHINNVAPPTSPNMVATKSYVDNLVQGLDAKNSVKLASTVNVALTGPATIDGTAVVTGDRVLLKDQTNPAENGIWSVQTGTAWFRDTDADAWTELVSAYVWVEQGTVNADTGWVCTVDQGGTLGTTAVTWVQFSGAGQINAGAGLTKTGNRLDVGAGYGITVNADTIDVTIAVWARKAYAFLTGNGSTTVFTVLHNLAVSAPHVQVWGRTSKAEVLCDLSYPDINNVVVGFGVAPANGVVYDVTVIG